MHGLYKLHGSMAQYLQSDGSFDYLVPIMFHVCYDKWHERLGRPLYPTIHKSLRKYAPNHVLPTKDSVKNPFYTIF